MPAKDPARSRWRRRSASHGTVPAIVPAAVPAAEPPVPAVPQIVPPAVPAAGTAVPRKRTSMLQQVGLTVLAAVPVGSVNVCAFIGQYAFVTDHVTWIFPGKVLVSATIESIGVYLALHAHIAQLKNDSSTRLKLGAYTVAAIVGAMNYSHYASHWHPTVMGVMMGMFSLMSPWLWGVHSHRISRDVLLTLGLIEEHAVRLGANRWTWHPWRSVRVMYWATWHGENHPKRAIAHFAGTYGTASDVPGPRRARLARRAVSVPAQPAVPPDVPEIEPPVPDVPPAAPEQPGAPEIEGGSVPEQPAVVPAAVLIDGTALNGVSPGTQVNGEVVVRANARLEADATLSGGKPSQAVIDEVEMQLSATPLDDLPSVRAIARLLGDPNQRRLAGKLREKRLAAEGQKEEAPARESFPRPEARPEGPQWIARPQRLGPGGMNG